MIKDWARSAADEICDEVYETSGPGTGISSDEMVAIIVKHCPLKPDVAYMPVPRCDLCARWKRHRSSLLMGRVAAGDCRGIERFAAINATREDFGCVQWKERS